MAGSRTWRHAALLIVLCVTLNVWAADADVNLIPNPSFEEGEAGWRWQIYEGNADQIVFRIDETVAKSGKRSALIESSDPAARAKWEFRIQPELGGLKQGARYRAHVWYRVEDHLQTGKTPDVRVRLASHAEGWAEYHGAWLEPVAHEDGWTLLAGEITLPQAQPWNLLLDMMLFYAAGRVWFDDAGLYLIAEGDMSGGNASASLFDPGDDWQPHDLVRPRPADGERLLTTPASFLWPPIAGAAAYELEYSRDPEFSGPDVTRVKGISLNMYTPPEAMAAGTWHWRVRPVLADGSPGPWTPSRAFVVPEDAPVFALPPIAEVLRRIPEGRPRLFVRPEELEAFRQRRFGELRLLWSVLAPRVSQYLTYEWMPEPEPVPGGGGNLNTRAPEYFRRVMQDSRRMGEAIEYLAFGYLVTGNRAYGEKAKEGILEFARWDPKGTTSWHYNDEPAMSILQSVPRAYDWVWDLFTDEERAEVLASMRARGEEVYAVFRSRPYEARPYISHPTRTLKFLGQVAIAFLGEIPEAEKWLDYVLNIFFAIYPPWGDTDGSYSEGPSYWKWYFEHALEFAHALKSATGIDLHQKPFFQNTGYYKLYMHPPYSKMSPFGDPPDSRPDPVDARNFARLASVYQNPYFKWYAEQVPGASIIDMMTYFWFDNQVKSRPPADLPQSRAFFDAGFVGMHTNLASGSENVMFLFKSSPYGSQSHGYAEQNTFYLEAFGEPLAISSGYYPYYGSPHHQNWTWQTIAHNGILVNGQGQTPRSARAAGRIVDFAGLSLYDYTVGDARRAYEPRLVRALRHVLFVKPHYILIFDDLAAPAPSTYTWLLHALSEMRLDESARVVQVKQGRANLDVTFAVPAALSFHQTDQFTVPPENNRPNQWHFQATTKERATEGAFLVALAPYKDGERVVDRVAALPATTLPGEPAAGVYAVRVDGAGWTDVSLFRRDGAQGGVIVVDAEAGRIETDAVIASVRRPRGEGVAVQRAFLYRGSILAAGGQRLFESDAPVTAAWEVRPGEIELNLVAQEPVRLEIQLPAGGDVTAVEAKRGGLSGWEYDAQASRLTLIIEAGETALIIQGATSPS